MPKPFDFERGVFAACVTPFWRDGSVDWPSLRAYVAEVAAGHPAGLAVNTAIGEAATLSPEETMEIVRRTKAVVGDKYPVVSGSAGFGGGLRKLCRT